MKTKLILIVGLLFCNGFIGQTTTWNQVTVPTTNALYDISFPTPTIGYIGGDTGTLLKTVDGGQNWTSISITLDNVAANYPLGAIHDLTFIDQNYGYMLMAEPNFSLFSLTPSISTLWETQNGGANWRQIEGNNSGMLSSLNMTSLYVKDTSNLFLGGHGWFYSSTIVEYNNSTWNGNLALSTSVSSYDAGVTDMDFHNGLGLATTNGQYILRSTDFGVTWDTINAGIGNFDPNNPWSGTNTVLTSIEIIDASTAYAGYRYNDGDFTMGLLKTIDGGLTWDFDMGSATFAYPDFTCLSSTQNGTVYSGGVINSGGTPSQGIIFESSSNLLWDYYYFDEAIYNISSNGLNQTFAVGENGFLVTNSQAITSIDQSPSELDFMVYPNPVQEQLIVEFTTEINGELILYDAAMKQTGITLKVSKLNNTIDVSRLPKGLYYLMFTKGNHRSIKKLVKQ
ncbi:MAG: YCF48-related protein [Parvicellaceae bacterium]